MVMKLMFLDLQAFNEPGIFKPGLVSTGIECEEPIVKKHAYIRVPR